MIVECCINKCLKVSKFQVFIRINRKNQLHLILDLSHPVQHPQITKWTIFVNIVLIHSLNQNGYYCDKSGSIGRIESEFQIFIRINRKNQLHLILDLSHPVQHPQITKWTIFANIVLIHSLCQNWYYCVMSGSIGRILSEYQIFFRINS